MRRLLPLLLLLAAAVPIRPPGAKMVSLIHAAIDMSGLVKRLYTFPLPAGLARFVGLTGNVSLSTADGHFAEALITAATYAGPDCGALNGARFASYADPGFPPLTHLASFTLKSTRAGTITLPVNAGFDAGVKLSACLVLVLDGGGAWGPGHALPSSVVLTSFLTLLAAPEAGQPVGIAYPVGAEVTFPPQPAAGGTARAVVLRANPAGPAAARIAAVFGDLAASPFDGTSGEPVPVGPWSAHADMWVYPSALCTAAFGPGPAFTAAFQAYQAALAYNGPPPGGRLVVPQGVGGQGGQGGAQGFSQFFPSLYLHPGDCLVSLIHVPGPTTGVIDVEQQATAILVP